MSHREESLVAVDVAARALLQAADWPACRGLPSVPVPTTLLGQLAGAVASVVEMPRAASERAAAPSRPKNPGCGGCGCDHCAALAYFPSDPAQYWCAQAECWEVLTTPNTYCVQHAPGPMPVIEPGVCSAVDCWRGPITPGGVCHFHSEYAQKPHPWQQMQMRAAVFQGGESE